MELLDQYNKLHKEILEYFAYNEGWSVYPIEDRREYYWAADDEVVCFSKDIQSVESLLDGDHYSDDRLTRYPLYRKDDYTLIVVDTHTDGNKFLAIYDNKKEIKE